MKAPSKKGSTAPRLLMLRVDQLKIHPENVRRRYIESEVQEMAASIKARGGVLHALEIVPSKEKGIWWVVAGNKRLAGARLLGKDCPLLKCEPVEADRAQQLLDMAIENFIRSDPNPVDEAAHYQRLLDSGLSVRDISKKTGIGEFKIRIRLEIMKLDEPIQELMAIGKLPHGQPVCQAFLTIGDRELRVELAQRLAKNPNTNTKTIVVACTRLLEANENQEKLVHPATELGLKGGPKKGNVSWRKIKSMAASACASCDLKLSRLEKVDNPAWSMIVHQADEECASCPIGHIRMVCERCPLPAFLKRLGENGQS
jgi:ParB/RepB/Spo0J family partition protein